MSLFLPLRRATLLIPSGPAGEEERKHLFVLLTDPYVGSASKASVLMVSLSSIKVGVPYDPSCILSVGDHAFVRHDSYVAYQRARLEEVDKLLRGVKNGQLLPHAPMNSAVFARICRGLELSRHTSVKLLNFYREATTS